MTDQPVFPAALQPAALALRQALPAPDHAPSGEFTVFIQGERLSAPYRIYHEARAWRSVIAGARGDTLALALCLGTRHHQGLFREECVRQLVAIERPWVVPFLVQLLSEYVVEIVEVIAAALPHMNPSPFTAFARENPQFMATARQRATSYWDCYHRGRFPTRLRYPGLVALEAIGHP